MGLEIVEGRTTKRPFAPDKNIAAKVKAAAFEEGLACYPMSGTRDGKLGDHVLLAPAFIISNDQIDELAEKLKRAINAVIG